VRENGRNVIVETLVLTSYFSSKKHPNSEQDLHVIGRNENGFVDQNSFDYIKTWYHSILRSSSKGVIFYDQLSKDFINEYSTDQINFVKVKRSNWSNLDYRWMCYEEYLENNTSYENVFLTDCSDVKVVQNPSKLIEDYKDIDLFLCKDSIKLCDFPYMSFHNHFELNDKVWFLLNQNNLDLINMGVVGGKRNKVLNFLEIYNSFRKSIGSPEFDTADMFCGQYAFRYLLRDYNFIIGEPVCSEFKKYQNDRKDVYFIHK
jgi:hypothetical protein